MNLAAETLLYPYREGLLDKPTSSTRLLFLNAENTTFLKELTAPVLMQPRYDKTRILIDAGHKVVTQLPSEKFDAVWVLPGKDIEEAQYLLAQALLSSKEGGIILAAAANNAGGKRLEGLFEHLDLSPQSVSKHKARAVFATVDGGYNRKEAEIWFAQGHEQKILSSEILSCTGLYGWDKVDTGSALLARQLPSDLSGRIADFGCGWGYLSLQATATSQKITHLTLVDIDARAISLAERNLQKQNPALSIDTLWADLSHPDPRLGLFDAILLNPPFHEGTHALPALGQAIITTAARSLRHTGKLYLVANRHLPYEKTLHELFNGNVRLLGEENGFKTFLCIKNN